MANPRKPFRINVGFIVHEEIGYDHEFPFEVSKIVIDDVELRNVEGGIYIVKMTSTDGTVYNSKVIVR